MSNSPSSSSSNQNVVLLHEELSATQNEESSSNPKGAINTWAQNKNPWREGALRWIYPLVIRSGFFYIHWVGTTTRWKIQGEESFFLERSKGRSIIFAFWHSQLMIMPFLYSALARGRKVSAMISQSRDGQIVSDLIERFGFDPIRGSSSRGGASALLRLSRKLREGFDLAISPDGPRGPRFYAQQGLVALALTSGCPIIPAAYNVKRKKVLDTWDHFMIPTPYNSGALAIGPSIQVSSNSDPIYLESKLKEVQKGLEEVNHQAEELVHSPR